MKIAIDVMGGDFAPQEIVKGALIAEKELGLDLILVGHEEKIKSELKKHGNIPTHIEVFHTTEIVEMGEKITTGIKKKESSMAVAIDMVKKEMASAVVSAGNTAVMMSLSLLKLGRIENIERPAIATALPTIDGYVLILDAGANVDCKPKHLFQFAVMGRIYAQKVMNKENPKVGILSIGEEETKGNDLIMKARELLKSSDINFIGNVEGSSIFFNKADVIVCDGFLGNMVLKVVEGILEATIYSMRKEIDKSILARLGLLFLLPTLLKLKKKFDYAEYGGAPLLGVNGVCIISHGKSNSKAIFNAIKVAKESTENNIVGYIKEYMQKEGEN